MFGCIIMATFKEEIERISNTNESTVTDEQIIKYLAHELGFNNAVVTCGLIYPYGQGRCFSINEFAKTFLTQMQEA